MPEKRVYVPDMTAPLMTVEDLLHTSIPDKRTDLVRGRLVVREPAGWRHGLVAMQLAGRLFQYLDRTGAGSLLAAETGFTLARKPDTVRAPDIAFVRRERLPDPATAGFPEFAPDLVVEVLSPDDRPGETLAKVGDWLEAGAQLVWVIDPERRLARVYRADGSQSIITESQQLNGEAVLPEFDCPLASIL
ncbi:MAG TPA: Uma2 family endonuclease [Gemmatimonadales bacterium]|nr:Uma2 family endonuclease [Gemmatimonadales bacterium]